MDPYTQVQADWAVIQAHPASRTFHPILVRYAEEQPQAITLANNQEIVVGQDYFICQGISRPDDERYVMLVQALVKLQQKQSSPIYFWLLPTYDQTPESISGFINDVAHLAGIIWDGLKISFNLGRVCAGNRNLELILDIWMILGLRLWTIYDQHQLFLYVAKADLLACRMVSSSAVTRVILQEPRNFFGSFSFFPTPSWRLQRLPQHSDS